MRIAPLTDADLALVDRLLPLHRLDQCRDGGATYLVAWYDSTPAGHVVIAWPGPALKEPSLPELQDLYVAPEYRRRGAARALTEAAEEAVSQRGFDRVMLGVGVDNEPARRLYERAGYVDAGLMPERVHGTITIRGEPVFVDDTLVYLVKRL